MSIRIALLAIVISLCLSANSYADTLKLNPSHPDTYVVIKGDTLWDISAKFLRDPWLWPEIWHVNPEINNPHLIYPGDIISLIWRDGKPMLQVQRGPRTIKLSPNARATRLDTAIATIPANVIGQFLSRPRILTEEELKRAGFISYAEENHMLSGTGDKVYVTNLLQDESKDFSIYRLGNVYRNPKDRNDILGYEAIHVSDAKLERKGDPATLRIIKSHRETQLGDKVMSTDEAELDQNFTPQSAEGNFKGQIIGILEGLSRAGQYQTVVLNLGKNDGMELGHVLAVRQKGELRENKESPDFFKPTIQLPDERAGIVMIVNVFDRVSYALIMSAGRDIRIGSSVTKP